MNPHRRGPGERLPPVPPPNEGPRPIREPDSEDMPDEKRTPNPDEVREPPIHTHHGFRTASNVLIQSIRALVMDGRQ